MRQIILATAALLALGANAHAASRIPAPVTVAVQVASGLGHGARPALPQEQQLARIAPGQSKGD